MKTISTTYQRFDVIEKTKQFMKNNIFITYG